MSNQTIFERHDLVEAAFSIDSFNHGIGMRLESAGLEDISEAMIALGSTRTFLKDALSASRAQQINSSEAIVVAHEAAIFQAKVASVAVVDTMEPMSNLRQDSTEASLPWSFSAEPYHAACGDWAGKERLFWIRQSVANQLYGMTRELQKADYGLHFEDAFRPLGVQEGLFKRRYKMAQSAHPEWSHDEIVLEARSKTAYTPRFAAHKGGAAVDVRVRDLQDGQLIDIGHDYPDGGATVALDTELVTQRQWENRYILALLARQAGLELYPFEDWHLCAGDTTAAACAKQEPLPIASYGPIKRFDIKTGEIQEIYSEQELDAVFEVNNG